MCIIDSNAQPPPPPFVQDMNKVQNQAVAKPFPLLPLSQVIDKNLRYEFFLDIQNAKFLRFSSGNSPNSNQSLNTIEEMKDVSDSKKRRKRKNKAQVDILTP